MNPPDLVFSAPVLPESLYASWNHDTLHPAGGWVYTPVYEEVGPPMLLPTSEFVQPIDFMTMYTEMPVETAPSTPEQVQPMPIIEFQELRRRHQELEAEVERLRRLTSNSLRRSARGSNDHLAEGVPDRATDNRSTSPVLRQGRDTHRARYPPSPRRGYVPTNLAAHRQGTPVVIRTTPGSPASTITPGTSGITPLMAHANIDVPAQRPLRDLPNYTTIRYIPGTGFVDPDGVVIADYYPSAPRVAQEAHEWNEDEPLMAIIVDPPPRFGNHPAPLPTDRNNGTAVRPPPARDEGLTMRGERVERRVAAGQTPPRRRRSQTAVDADIAIAEATVREGERLRDLARDVVRHGPRASSRTTPQTNVRSSASQTSPSGAAETPTRSTRVLRSQARAAREAAVSPSTGNVAPPVESASPPPGASASPSSTRQDLNARLQQSRQRIRELARIQADLRTVGHGPSLNAGRSLARTGGEVDLVEMINNASRESTPSTTISSTTSRPAIDRTNSLIAAAQRATTPSSTSEERLQVVRNLLTQWRNVSGIPADEGELPTSQVAGGESAPVEPLAVDTTQGEQAAVSGDGTAAQAANEADDDDKESSEYSISIVAFRNTDVSRLWTDWRVWFSRRSKRDERPSLADASKYHSSTFETIHQYERPVMRGDDQRPF